MIREIESIRIFEYRCRFGKRDAVLRQVALRFRFVPLEHYVYTKTGRDDNPNRQQG